MSITVNQAELRHIEGRLEYRVLEEATKDARLAAATSGFTAAKIAAPYDRGDLRASLHPTISGGGAAPWYGYATSVVYGEILDKPARRNPHYRNHARRGQSTRGWFSDTAKIAQERLAGEAKKAAKRIEDLWRR